MGPDPPDGAVPEHIPAQGRVAAHLESAKVEVGG